MLRFLERNGYDLSYTTDVDSARRGHLIKNHQVFMAVGHDEYWSNEQRANVEAARDAGVHLAFLTGNEIFWKTRWEKSIDPSRTDWRTLACYKETQGHPERRPRRLDGHLARSAAQPAAGRRPTGERAAGQHLHRQRSAGGLAPGPGRLRQDAAVAQHVVAVAWPPARPTRSSPARLGYEWNTVEDNGFQPAGVAQLSRPRCTWTARTCCRTTATSTAPAPRPTRSPTTGTRAARWCSARARCSGRGAWTTSTRSAPTRRPPTCGCSRPRSTSWPTWACRPTTLAGRPGRSRDGSTDTPAPTVAITDVPATVARGRAVHVLRHGGRRGGQVGGVEVSTDGGTRVAPGRVAGRPDDVELHLHPVGVRPGAVCGCARWTTRRTCRPPCRPSPDVSRRGPARAACGPTPTRPTCRDSRRHAPLELGVKWRANTDGYVRGVRFYKGARNTGTHTGTPVVGHGAAAGDGHVHRRDGVGLADADLPGAGRGHREHHLRRLVLRADRALLRRHASTSAASPATWSR